MRGYLRRMQESDLESVLTWRNHPDIRRFMYTSHIIGMEEHCRWFEREKNNADRHLLIYEEQEQALGYVNLHQMAKNGIYDWGFYISPEAQKGTGIRLGQATFSYARTLESFHKLCAQVLGNNTRSLAFHKKLGFIQEGILRQQHFDGCDFVDVVCFGLLHNEIGLG